MTMNSRSEKLIEEQKQRIVELCKERYPDSVDVFEIEMRTGWKINKNILDGLIDDGILEWDDLTRIKIV